MLVINLNILKSANIVNIFGILKSANIVNIFGISHASAKFFLFMNTEFSSIISWYCTFKEGGELEKQPAFLLISHDNTLNFLFSLVVANNFLKPQISATNYFFCPNSARRWCGQYRRLRRPQVEISWNPAKGWTSYITTNQDETDHTILYPPAKISYTSHAESNRPGYPSTHGAKLGMRVLVEN